MRLKGTVLCFKSCPWTEGPKYHVFVISDTTLLATSSSLQKKTKILRCEEKQRSAAKDSCWLVRQRSNAFKILDIRMVQDKNASVSY